MSTKFLTAALVVAAFGCARSGSTPATTAPTARAETKTVAVTTTRELKPVGVAKELTPDAAKQEPGVALHGPAKTYLDQSDNSGWSGRTPGLAPTAVGGGPAAGDGELKSDEEQTEEK
jgi:hypothetical protein